MTKPGENNEVEKERKKEASDRPDLVNDQEMFAVAIVNQPIWFADAERKRRQSSIFSESRRFGYISRVFPIQYFHLLHEFASKTVVIGI